MLLLVTRLSVKRYRSYPTAVTLSIPLKRSRKYPLLHKHYTKTKRVFYSCLGVARGVRPSVTPEAASRFRRPGPPRLRRARCPPLAGRGGAERRRRARWRRRREQGGCGGSAASRSSCRSSASSPAAVSAVAAAAALPALPEAARVGWAGRRAGRGGSRAWLTAPRAGRALRGPGGGGLFSWGPSPVPGAGVRRWPGPRFVEDAEPVPCLGGCLGHGRSWLCAAVLERLTELLGVSAKDGRGAALPDPAGLGWAVAESRWRASDRGGCGGSSHPPGAEVRQARVGASPPVPLPRLSVRDVAAFLGRTVSFGSKSCVNSAFWAVFFDSQPKNETELK